MAGAAPTSSAYERELANILEATHAGYVERGAGSLGIDLTLFLATKGSHAALTSVHQAVPVEVKASKEPVLRLSNTPASKQQYDQYEAWHDRVGFSPAYALRLKRHRPRSAAWRFFPWPQRPGPGAYPILRWEDGQLLEAWLEGLGRVAGFTAQEAPRARG